MYIKILTDKEVSSENFKISPYTDLHTQLNLPQFYYYVLEGWVLIPNRNKNKYIN